MYQRYNRAKIMKKTELTMRSERKKQIHLHFSEPQGRKAHAVGLKRKAENGKLKDFLGLLAISR